MDFIFSILFAIVIVQRHSIIRINWNDRTDNPSEIVPTTPDDDICKCVSYTEVHIDISHQVYIS